MTPLAQWGNPRVDLPPVDLSAYDIQGMRMMRDPFKFFELTNFYTGVNPPPTEDAGLMALFQTAGVGPGSTLPTDPHLREAIAQGAADAQAAMNARITAGPFRDGWTVPDPEIGKPGPHILSRATCQLSQTRCVSPGRSDLLLCPAG